MGKKPAGKPARRSARNQRPKSRRLSVTKIPGQIVEAERMNEVLKGAGRLWLVDADACRPFAGAAA
jgi:hypothetical protein